MKHSARAIKVWYGETQMGTGPGGGHSGDQWQALVKVYQGKKMVRAVRVIMTLLNNAEEPSKKDIEFACVKAYDKHVWLIKAEEQSKKYAQEEKRNQRKLNARVKKLVGTTWRES